MASFADVIALLQASKYFLLFAGSYIEGTAVMLSGGILWRLGQVDFLPAYAALLFGDFLADLMWYAIGYFGARPFIIRWGHLFNVTPLIVEKVERRFHRHHTWILIFSKLTMGFGLAVATLMTAGMLRVSLVRYIVINLLAGFVWVFFIMAIGYYFGNILTLMSLPMQVMIGVSIIVGFFFVVRAINTQLAKSDW